MRFVEWQTWSSWERGWGVGIEGEIGWSWFHLCTSMIAPTVYKNAQAPFEPKRFEEVENKYVIACICVLYLYYITACEYDTRTRTRTSTCRVP